MKPGLQLRVSQHLALTPQLQQSIRLLQLSTLELEQEVEQLLDQNPFLERSDDADPNDNFGLDRSDASVSEGDRVMEVADEPSAPAEGEVQADAPQDWDGDGGVDIAPDDAEWGGDAPARAPADDDAPDASALSGAVETLHEHLHRQALSLRLGDVDAAALRFLIDSLNDDGYLEDSLVDLAAGLCIDSPDALDDMVHHLTVALHLLQHMEPRGVGARNLAECMRIQLEAMRRADDERELIDVALRLCAQPLELMAKRDFKRLVLLCGCDDSQVRSAMALIARLEPKPGRRFAQVERNIVIPDVIVTRSGAGAQARLRVSLNADVMPRLRVHEVYAGALKGRRGEPHQALSQRLQEARWFIRNVQQRFDTILRVSQAIVERQRNFFIHGDLAMRPLVLREIADELGLHESTISRVTSAKYMSTPYGTFELKYFFGSSLGTETGGSASSTAVRALIRQFVAAEDATKPLSDSQLSNMLAEQGIDCARRTVAKYREALRIAPANLRKAI